MRVLVIPEDFPDDQYVLQPIVAAMLAHLGRKQARVRVCAVPRLRGIGEALKWERQQEIIQRYRGMVDLFLLCVDRDGEAGRRSALDALEQQARSSLPAGCAFLAENAWQEIEVWVLAGHALPPEWDWSEVRNEPHPKERYLEPFARQRGVADGPGKGRKALAEEAAKSYRQRIRRLCPEDVQALEKRIGAWIESGSNA